MAEPGDFFAADVTQADFDRQRQLGTMGPGNLPCYVQSVTYGRMLVYTMTSTEATSAQELQLAVQASYGAWEGSGDLDSRQRQLVQNSSIEVQVFGGTQEDQLDAIKQALHTGDFSSFLVPVPSTTAVPLSYRINDLKNRQPAVIGDATQFSIRECEAVNDLRFTVSLDSITVVDGCTRPGRLRHRELRRRQRRPRVLAAAPERRRVRARGPAEPAPAGHLHGNGEREHDDHLHDEQQRHRRPARLPLVVEADGLPLPVRFRVESPALHASRHDDERPLRRLHPGDALHDLVGAAVIDCPTIGGPDGSGTARRAGGGGHVPPPSRCRQDDIALLFPFTPSGRWTMGPDRAEITALLLELVRRQPRGRRRAHAAGLRLPARHRPPPARFRAPPTTRWPRPPWSTKPT